MANIIQRIIQLVLDKDSANKTQSDIDGVASHVESTWKEAAAKIAEYLGVAFLIEKVVEFGKSSVEEAMKSDAAWAALANTIDNAGGSFNDLQDHLHKTAMAFEDATTYGPPEFATALGRMIALTGDVGASLNNMGLVANVAAKYFNGDLEPAANLVSKAMNGNVTMLKRLGITAVDAQSALEILATRSMGAAEKAAGTAAGQSKQLANEFTELEIKVGEAIIGSDGATTAFTVLKAAIATLSDWVVANKTEIARWVTEGVKFAIDAADVFIRAVSGMADILKGGFLGAIGLASEAVAKFELSLIPVREVLDAIQKYLNIGDPAKAASTTKNLKDQATALDAWGAAMIALGGDKVKKGIDTLSTPLFDSSQFTNAPKKKEALPGEDNTPQVGKNVSTDATKAIAKAIKDYNEEAKAAANETQILGDKFDAVGADVSRTTKLIDELAKFGVQPASVGFAGLSEHLQQLTTVTVPMTTETKALAKSLKDELAVSAITVTESLTPMADHLASLKTQQSDVLKTIKDLIADGFDPGSAVIAQFTLRYQALGEEIKKANIAATLEELSMTLSKDLFKATLDSATSLDKLNIEHAALQKAIQKLLDEGVSKEDAALKALVARYKDVTDAIKEQTVAMQVQAAMADFLADALATAMTGGLKQAAGQKARENEIQAAEMLVRAGAFALFGDAPQATGALILAGQFAAVAVAWAALGAASSGGGGDSAAPTVPASSGGSSSSGTAAMASSSAASSSSASNAQSPGAEVSIYMVGPGFNALNPEVQRVVYGAQQNAIERFGANARIRVQPTVK